MPWFFVDDDFAFHPKAIAAGDAALGLWVRAGSYSSKYLTEGFVSDGALSLLRAKPAQVRSLVNARPDPTRPGLWVEGDGGFLFHQWEDRQRSRDQVEADRAAAAERQRRARQRKTESRGESRRDGQSGQRQNRGLETVTGASILPSNSSLPDIDSAGHSVSSRRESRCPRPAPPRNYLLTLISRLAALETGATKTPPPAEEVVSSWQELAGPGVDLEAEAVAYLQRFGDRPARDERGAWLGWLGAARRRAGEVPRGPGESPPTPCSHPDCVGGWLADDPTTGRAVPCPTCKPHRQHLQPVPDSDAREAS